MEVTTEATFLVARSCKVQDHGSQYDMFLLYDLREICVSTAGLLQILDTPLSNQEVLKVSVACGVATHPTPSNAFSLSNSSALAALFMIYFLYILHHLIGLLETEQCGKQMRREIFRCTC